MERPFHMVDVFSTVPFGGNPLAVVLDAEGLSTDEMQTITRWMNLSETVFLLPPTRPEADYRARIFTIPASCRSPATRPSAPATRGWPQAAPRARTAGSCRSAAPA